MENGRKEGQKEKESVNELYLDVIKVYTNKTSELRSNHCGKERKEKQKEIINQRKLFRHNKII